MSMFKAISSFAIRQKLYPRARVFLQHLQLNLSLSSSSPFVFRSQTILLWYIRPQNFALGYRNDSYLFLMLKKSFNINDINVSISVGSYMKQVCVKSGGSFFNFLLILKFLDSWNIHVRSNTSQMNHKDANIFSRTKGRKGKPMRIPNTLLHSLIDLKVWILTKWTFERFALHD